MLQLAIGCATLFFFYGNVAKAESNATFNAANTFQSTCAMCHGKDGGGSEVGKSLHAPDLRSAKVQSQSNKALARFISEGKGAMPSFAGQLSPAQILHEVHYIRSLAKRNAAHQ
ncbi:MAG: cytochrome c [Acidobacteriaceae bacterium]